MATKLQSVSQFSAQTAKLVTGSVDAWKSYLTTASRMYKYRFDEQLLIYAQRPNATACAEMELWNSRMRRWVKAGSKGIALIRQEEGGRPYLTYVFDLEDTRPVRGAKTPYLWKMQEEHQETILSALSARYGKPEGEDFPHQLMDLAARAAKEMERKSLADLDYDLGSGKPDTDNKQGQRKLFLDTLTASVQYAILSRCGIEPEAFLDDQALSGITSFSTPAMLHHLGYAVSSVSMELLQEIGRSIRAYDREHWTGQKKQEEKAKKTLEKPSPIGYTDNRDNFNTLKYENKERSIDNGRTDVQEKRGIPDPQPGDRGGNNRGTAPWQVRDASADLPDGQPSRDLHLDAADRAADAPLNPDRPAGPGTGRQDSGRNDGTGRNQRELEGTGSDGMVKSSKQPDHAGGRNGAGRDRLPVNQKSSQTEGEAPSVSAFQAATPENYSFSLFPTVEQQLNTINHISDSVIDYALACGGNRENSQERIIAFYQRSSRLSDAAAFLKEEYGTGGKGIFTGNYDYSLWFGEEGIRIAFGHTANFPDAALISWEEAARRISVLLDNGRYASQDKLDAAGENELHELSTSLWYLCQNLDDSARNQGFLPHILPLYRTFTDSTTAISKQLRTKEGRESFLEDLKAFSAAYQQNPKLLNVPLKRSHPGYLIQQISSLEVTPKQFQAQNGFIPAKASFITQDEVDWMLAYGGGASKGKLRIYGYFMQEHTPAERAEFLKNEYGTGGRGGSGYEFWYNAKGLGLKREDDYSGTEGYDTLLLTWNQVQRQVRELIQAGRYLSPEEMKAFQHGELSPINPLSGTLSDAGSSKSLIGNQKPQTQNKESHLSQNKNNPAPASESADNLEDVARVLSNKQRPKTKEASDGQLSFDFGAMQDNTSPSDSLGITPEAITLEPTALEQIALEQTALEPTIQEKAGTLEKSTTLTETNQALSSNGEDLKKAIEQIKAFALRAYGNEDMDFWDLGHIPLAYTVTEDGKHEIQVEADLQAFSIRKFIDGKCTEQQNFTNLREMVDTALRTLEFNQLVQIKSLQESPQPIPGQALSKPSEQPSTPLPGQISTPLSGQISSQLPEQTHSRFPEQTPAPASSSPAAPQSSLNKTHSGYDQKSISSHDQKPFSPHRQESVFSNEWTEIEGGKIPQAAIEPTLTSPSLTSKSISQNFRITDEQLGTGGAKTKYQNNLAAIRTLKQIEQEGRLALPNEQEILSRYTGWGGLFQAFDPDNSSWSKEYAQLKELLTPQEYESAKASVLNAHYTSPAVIRAIYGAINNMNFTPGNILEPSCGIGNFFGLVPEDLNQANLYGVELDSLTGRIAKQLYQKANITISGFETTNHPDDFFDLAVGNVPFGEYKVHDKRYDKQNLLIHDYFLVKSLDKVRPGGIAAFITTKGTMDKASTKTRQTLAQKADLLGAIRLPNNAFQANAGTAVTTDILFFQKRAGAPEKLPDWVQTGQTDEGIPLNSYYLQHPEMVLGKMSFWKNMYGNETETACLPEPGQDLSVQLSQAIAHITAPNQELLHMDSSKQEDSQEPSSIPADPDVRNFSFTLKENHIYFRENSRMKQMEPGRLPAARIQGMIAVRDHARHLIDLQLSGADDAQIKQEQQELSKTYDQFSAKYGLLNSPANRLAFRQDSSYPLLCSLEVLDDEGNLKRKADMFTRRTIKHHQAVTRVDTAVEALGISIGERAAVDLNFMASLLGGKDKILQIIEELKGIIFKDPTTGPFLKGEGENWDKGWQTRDAYLSGNVRKKLEEALSASQQYPEFSVNAKSLQAVQPKDLTAPEISVRIGAPWIDLAYYRQFMYELLQTPRHLQKKSIDVMYNDFSGEWYVKGKSADSTTNARVWNTYGSKRVNAYAIMEACLNQRNVQVFDTREEDGREIRVLNEKQTAIAQQKQEAIKEAFQGWIFNDPARRADLCRTYNQLFNSTRPREYDGQHIQFVGMNPEIRLEPHQQNAVARILYGGNTLLAHVVGAGKTFEVVAAAMESKRLGLCQKSMIVVPNHLTEQWGGDFLRLYPGANILVAGKKDFEPKNRRKFCARISTGDYDAVIIGHSQFEKIPISPKRQAAIIQEQIDEVVFSIAKAKSNKEERFTIKQMELTKKSLQARLDKLYDKKKDDTVYFEELGIDRLFVDEAQAFKNLYTHTKMRNVAGISQTDAQKSSDMFAKCRYMDEITGGRGIIFATGTPISNSVVELYTMMRYLQNDVLERGFTDSTGKSRSLKHFDNWAATFGEQVTAVELKPEGTGFRLKTRFSRFYNLPELMKLWKEAADIQTADMLNLPVPEVEYVTIQTEPSAAQKQMVQDLAARAEKIRKEHLDPSMDNLLKITSDGRKLALDQRIMNPLLPDDPGSKVNACVENVFKIWKESTPTKGTQLIFSDLSTPKAKGKAQENGQETSKETDRTEINLMESSVYEDIRKKLMIKGIPSEEIAFIHSANTEIQKAELFAKVRSGQVRILLGSTQKMGAGTNVQTKLIASHDLDCPWRPADLAQRAGRIVRRGNENKQVKIFRYVTKGTFDAYTWVRHEVA